MRREPDVKAWTTTRAINPSRVFGITLQPSNIARQRLNNQRLVGPVFAQAGDAVGWLGAVQAQDFAGAKWALAQRMTPVTSEYLDHALARGEIIRTHVLRPTWHFVTPRDLRWMLALTAPRVHAVNAYSYRKFELDAALLSRTRDLIRHALEGSNHLTRPELANALARAGIAAAGMRLAYIIMHAELEALICSGPLRGKQFTYALLDERASPQPNIPREEALHRLADRYFRSHGPATVQDFAWWSGLTVADARTAAALLGPDFASDVLGKETFWFATGTSPIGAAIPAVHLLPNYDELLIAYKNHDHGLSPSLVGRPDLIGRAFDGHIVIVNGQASGGWRREIKAQSVELSTNLLIPVDELHRAALMVEVERYGRFLGLPATLVT